MNTGTAIKEATCGSLDPPPAVVAGLFALLASSSALAQDYSCTPTNFSVWTAQYNNQRTGANTSEGCLTPTNAGSGTMAQQLQLLHALRAKHALAIEPDRCRVLLGELHRRLRLQPGLRSAALRLPSYGYRRDRRHGEYCRCRDANRPGLRLRRHCHAEHNQPVQRTGALGKMVLVSKPARRRQQRRLLLVGWGGRANTCARPFAPGRWHLVHAGRLSGGQRGLCRGWV